MDVDLQLQKVWTSMHIDKLSANELMVKKHLSANTVVHHHAIIRKCLEYAFKMDIIPSNPADKVQKPKVEQYIGSY